ncbi:MAG: helix-turn-helix transcriptional regulator [Lachnospiraceae bacterium]|nr:helix-turn-helix transcriptional regulator [Lachnospiraceae bacterium]
MTELATLLRIIRAENNMYLQDMANILGVTKSYLSMVEKGKSPFKEDWIYKLQKALDLSEERVEKLQEYTCINETIRLLPKSEKQRKLVLKLARTLNTLKEEDADAILSILEGKKPE